MPTIDSHFAVAWTGVGSLDADMGDPHILILGGTSEARQLAERLVHRGGAAITLSLAGRTKAPLPQAGRLRVGGFGGAEGLAAFLRKEKISVLVDATHPFAARISANAEAAVVLAGAPLIVLQRPEWTREPGDIWLPAGSAAEAAALLGSTPKRIFLAIGRNELDAFRNSAHRFLIRSVDPVEAPEAGFADAAFLLDRGPFDAAAEKALLREHGIEAVVAKNSGGEAAYGKIAAARDLGLPVILIARPRAGRSTDAGSVAEAFTRVLQAAGLPAERGE